MYPTAIKAFYVAFFYMLLGSCTQAEQTLTYKNQRGSTLTLVWHDAGKKNSEPCGSLTGTFISAVGKCATGLSLPMTGVFNGNAIALTLNLVKCRQVIVMTGNTSENKDEIHMLWLDTAQAADPQKKDWNCNIIGTDHYRLEKQS